MENPVKILEVAPQGDVLMFSTREDGSLVRVPADAIRVQPERGRLLVTHSETGHHHAVDARPGLELFQHPQNPLVGWLRITKEAEPRHADVVHHRPWDTHPTLRLLYSDSPTGETVFEIRRQRERAPEGWRRVAD